MRKALLIALVGPVLFAACDPPAGERPAWNDINVIRENVEAPRAIFTAQRNDDDASYYQSLNGDWKFNYSDSPAARPAGSSNPAG
ncbi:MAG: hypothetical protein AAFN50_15145, partial [Pseudomonadota bacterium]